MTLSITHAKVSGMAAGSNPSKIYGTDWDANHTLTGTLSSTQLDLTMSPTWTGTHTFSNALSAVSYKIGSDVILTHPLTSAPTNDARTNISLGYGALTAITPSGDVQYMTAVGFNAAGSLTTADHITAVGAWSLNSITGTTGSHNSGFGIDAMRGMLTGTYNTAVGEQAMHMTAWASAAASYNVAVGAVTMAFAGGTYNTGVGYQAMIGSVSSPLTGTGNTAVGAFAASALAGAVNNNTAVGEFAINALTGGSANTAIGNLAGFGLTTGNNNTIIGFAVGNSKPTTGSYNILIGVDNTTQGYTTTTANAIAIGQGTKPGSNDIAIGTTALASTTQNSNNNIAIGTNALNATTTGSQNVAVGYGAGATVGGGYYNTLIGGASGGVTLATGHDNILIGTPGNPADTAAAGTNSSLNIGNAIKGSTLGTVASQIINIPGTLDASSATNAALTVTGGLGVAKDIYGGGNITINRATSAQVNLFVGGTQISALYSDAAQTILSAITSVPLILKTNNTERLKVDASGNVIVNTAAINTTATDGFLYIPTCAGAPTGTPTAYTGRVPIVYDTTNNKFYVYNGGWKGGTAPGAWS